MSEKVKNSRRALCADLLDVRGLAGAGAFVTALRFLDLNFSAPTGALRVGFPLPGRLMRCPLFTPSSNAPPGSPYGGLIYRACEVRNRWFSRGIIFIEGVKKVQYNKILQRDSSGVLAS